MGIIDVGSVQLIYGQLSNTAWYYCIVNILKYWVLRAILVEATEYAIATERWNRSNMTII